MRQTTYLELVGQFLVSFFFIVLPFSWSYLGVFSGFVLRLADLTMLVIILFGLVFGKNSISRLQASYFIAFSLMFMLMAISAMVNNNMGAFVSIIKISFYMMGSYFICKIILNQKNYISIYIFLFYLISLFIYVFIFKFEIISVLINLFPSLLDGPTIFAFKFWNAIFTYNLFGPSGLIDVKGVSFRNTASFGFLATSLYIYSMIKPSTLSYVLTFVYLILMFSCLSRTASICGVLFVISIFFFGPAFRGKWIVFLILAAVVMFILNSFIWEIVVARASSNFGRWDMFVEGFSKISQAPFVGNGIAGKIEGGAADQRTIHNVPLALGSEFGFFVMVIAIWILVLNLQSFLGFSFMLAKRKGLSQDRSVLVGLVTAFALVARPNLSASAEVFYSVAEWACLALLFVSVRRAGLFGKKAARFA